MSTRLQVDVVAQRMNVWENECLVTTYPVSTSRFGLGSEEGSFRTPTGRFTICEKIGEGAPLGAIFHSRIPTGQVWHEGCSDEDAILTRILWLDGCDAHNANTRTRYIYIHGTPEEHLIGTPSSHGCIRMRNATIAELFERVTVGTEVVIG